MSTKYCFIKGCKKNSKRNLDNFFFRVPYNKQLRRQWCLTTGRDPDTLRYSSAAYCCSDHFNLELDLNRIASTSKKPVLRSDVLPSLTRHDNQQMQIVEVDNSDDRAGDNAPRNLFVREVVYLKENNDDHFLEEANPEDEVDTLNTEPDPVAKDIIEILDDDKPSEATPAGTNDEASLPKKIVLMKNKNKAPIKNAPNQPLILRHITQMDSDRKQDAVKFIPISKAKSPEKPPPKIVLGKTKAKVIHETAVYKSVVNSAPASIRAPSPVASTSKAHAVHAVNKSKYLNVNELKKLQIEPNAKQSNRPLSDDDDDCVLIEEQNGLGNTGEVVTTKNTDSTVKLLTTLPSSISIRSVSGGESTRTVQPLKLVFKNNPKPVPIQKLVHRPISGNELVPVQTSKLRVRDFSKIIKVNPNAAKISFVSQFSQQKIAQDKVLRLINLMISENEKLFGRYKGQIVKTEKANEFSISNDVFYFRMSDESDRNYFVMNITQQCRHAKDTIVRPYVIQWGNPRRRRENATKISGVLTDEIKDLVFQKVKMNLLEKGEEHSKNLDSSVLVRPAPSVIHTMASPGRVAMNRQISGKPITASGTKKPVATVQKGIMNPDEGSHNKGMVVQTPISKNFATPKEIAAQRPVKRVDVQGAIAKNTATPKEVFVQGPISKNTASPKEIVFQRPVKRVDVQGAIAKNTATPKEVFVRGPIAKNTATPKEIVVQEPTKKTGVQRAMPKKATTFDAFPTRPVIKILTSPEKAMVKTPPRIKSKKNLIKVPTPDDTNDKNQLIKLSQYLTPKVRNIINKLKYYEMNCGKMFSVKIGDGASKDKPFNTVFTETEPQFLAKIRAKPVPRSTHVSKLVAHSRMGEECREPIPIPPPQDIKTLLSDATPKEMEELMIRQSKRTYTELSKLEAAFNNSHVAQNMSDLKHKCPICGQVFEKKYQLRRHMFIAHNELFTDAGTSPSITSNVLTTIPDTIKRAFHDIDNEPCDDDLLSPAAIKTEEPDETIESDPSVPLYEELVKEARNDGSFVKEEFEEHFDALTDDNFDALKDDNFDAMTEEHFEALMTRPLSLGTETDHTNNRNVENDDDDESADETDSAPETLTDVTPSTEKRRVTFKVHMTLEKQRRQKEKRIATVKDNERNRKIIRVKRLQKTSGKRNMVTGKSIKISRANEPTDQWPSLTVNLGDINFGMK